MNCRQARKQLELYHLGALDPPRAERVREHLSACEACGAELARLEALDQALGALPEGGATGDLWPGVRARLAPRDPRPTWVRDIWQPAAAAAVAIVLAVVLVNGALAPGTTPADLSFSPETQAPFSEQYAAISWQTPLADDAALGARLAMVNEGGDES